MSVTDERAAQAASAVAAGIEDQDDLRAVHDYLRRHRLTVTTCADVDAATLLMHRACQGEPAWA
jgi:glycerol-3-phosphate dehydrogenase